MRTPPATARYDTYMYGKFLNQYVERSRYQPPGYYPRGWTVFQALTHENTYAYYNSCFALNGSPRECFPGQYQTDLITEMATGTIRWVTHGPVSCGQAHSFWE